MKRGISKWLWRLVVLLVLGAALAFAFLNAGRFLEGSAQPPQKADLLAALGGDKGGRAYRTLELYRKGFAPRVLLTGQEGGHSRTRNTYLHWRARYLVDEGIPESALLFDRESANSWQEAKNTLKLMRERKLDRVLVVSDPPHLRRLSWVWSKVFAGSGKTYVLVPSDLETWDADNWWKTSPNAQFVFSEVIKLAYYLTQY